MNENRRKQAATEIATLVSVENDLAWLCNNYGLWLYHQARLEEAEPLFRRALAIDERSYGPRHPNVAIRLNSLAGFLQTTHRLAEAEPLYRHALAIFEQSYGPDHPNVAIRLSSLAGFLRATNRLAEAEPLFQRALAILEQSYGPDHPQIATTLNNLAELLRATNRLAEAEPLVRRALAILLNFTQATGHKHPHLRAAIENYKRLLEEMGLTVDLITHRLAKVGRKGGFDEEHWRQLLAQLQ